MWTGSHAKHVSGNATMATRHILIGAVVAALTVCMRRTGVLLALLALPLYVPVLVFGAGVMTAAGLEFDPSGGLLLLAAGLVMPLALAPRAANWVFQIPCKSTPFFLYLMILIGRMTSQVVVGR